MAKDNLSQEQKAFVLQNFDKLTLLELTRKAFNNNELDGRCKEGKIIKNFLAAESLDYKTSKFEKSSPIDLTKEQEDYIKNNASIMNACEIARILFNNNSLNNLNKETRTVWEFIQNLPKELVCPQEIIPDGNYQAPKAISRAISKINKFCNFSWKETDLSNKELECCESLIRYLNSYRFLYMINAYKKERDRELFESQFIAHVYDKYDLLSEEINSYLNLCAEYVIMANAQEQKEILDERLRRLSEDEDGKMSMSLNEAIANKSEEISASIKRQKDMMADLVGKRSQRMKSKYDENAALTLIFEAWNSKKERDVMIKIAEKRKLLVKQEKDRLEDADEFMVKIMGISEDEVLY